MSYCSLLLRETRLGEESGVTPFLDQLGPPVPGSKTTSAAPPSMLLTHRTERHSWRRKCTQKPLFDFQRISRVFCFRFVLFFLSAWKMVPWHFPVLANSSDKQPAVVKSPTQAQGTSCPWCAWLPAVLCNKPLTLLKRWHFSSLFIKRPKEYSSWCANKRGTGEKCFSPGFPEPWNLPPSLPDTSCFPEQPHKYQKNTIQQNRGPGRRTHAVWTLRPGSLWWLDVSESATTVSKGLLKEYAEGKFFWLQQESKRLRNCWVKISLTDWSCPWHYITFWQAAHVGKQTDISFNKMVINQLFYRNSGHWSIDLRVLCSFP